MKSLVRMVVAFSMVVAGVFGTSVAANAEPAAAPSYGAQEARWQCGADTVRIYSAPDGAGVWTGYVVHNGVYVNVIDHYNGVWWHINSPQPGWVLAQYFC